MSNSFLFLGSGGSLGIPVVGCSCEVCRSSSPYNKRLRPSGVLSYGGKRLLIDVGPDFRAQALKFGVNHLDGLLITHTHFDHIAGFDELRVFPFQAQKRLPCLLSDSSMKDLSLRYYYLLHKQVDGEVVSSKFNFQILEGDFGTTDFLGVEIGYVSYTQAEMKVTGFRFGDFAYISDIRYYTDAVPNALRGVKTLVLSALRSTTSEAHFTIQDALHFSRLVGAKQTWLTHIAHELDHLATNAQLPGDVQLAYDGLEIPL
jgi:phosphoribosyl 1,2-cyclic phosphate phosphodiesterase